MLSAPLRGELIHLDMSEPGKGVGGPASPFLVLSPVEFNKRTGLVIVLPVGAGPKVESGPFSVPIAARARTATKGQRFVLAHHPMTLEWRIRLVKKEPTPISESELLEICTLLDQIINVST